MRLEWELAVRGYRRYAAYPAATWAGILTNTVFGFIQAYVLLALFETRDDIGGYDATDDADVRLADAGDARRPSGSSATPTLPSGSSAVTLRRTSSGPCIRCAQAWPSTTAVPCTTQLFRGLPPLVVGAIVFDLTAPSNPLVWAVFLVSVVLAIAVSFAFRFLYNLAAFWLLDYRGAMRIAVAVAAFFSGFIIPVRFFPDWLQTLAYATPFPSMLQLPVDVFVGVHDRVQSSSPRSRCRLGWLLALLATCYAVFSRGTRKLVVQGG